MDTNTAIIGRMADVTQILSQIEDGDPNAAELLLPLVYDELRKLAAAKLAHEKPGQTLQATALVHDAYIRLVDTEKAQHWHGRRYFFSAAAEAMRRILVDRARKKLSKKHGGDQDRVDFVEMNLPSETTPDKLLLVHEALDGLAAESPIQADVVKLRFFVGMSYKEIANALNLSEKTVKRYWAYARAWLYDHVRN